MKFQPQSYRINDFYNWLSSKELILSPRFQRRKVWSTRGKSYLIDSILRGMPIPQIFMREVIDPVKHRTTREVVDGQQRLSTILSFIAGDVYVMKSHSFNRRQLLWSDLTDDEKKSFLAFPLSVNILEDASDADVLAVFSRINAYSLPLNAQEKLNAEFVGEFRQFVDNLAAQQLQFWLRNEILTEQNIARMRDAELIAELVGLMLRGLQNQKRIVGELYKEFDDAFVQGDYIEPRLGRTLQICDSLCDGQLPELIYHRSVLFYSLFGAVYDASIGFGADEHAIQRDPRPDAIPTVAAALRDLSVALDNAVGNPNFANPTYKQFFDAARSSTDKLPERRTRHEILLGLIREAF